MTRSDWLNNIENEAVIASEKLDSAAVRFVFAKYDATSTEDLHESNYPDVWAELYLMSQDN